MSNIEWTEQTWNPIIGCSKISAGCENCYAEKMAYRLSNIKSTSHYKNVMLDDGHPEYGTIPELNGQTYFVQSQLDKPLKRKKPTMYFVCSMGDLFHESVPHHWFEKIMDVIEKCPQHTFQILTKRSSRMRKQLDHWYFGQAREGKKFPLPNLWVGVTAENQEQANKRIPNLLITPAVVKFVSVEPMLGPIDFYEITLGNELYHSLKGFGDISGSQGYGGGPKLDWVILGGESGPNARPLHPDWVRSIRDQCKDAKTPFFFKQWGEWCPGDREKEGTGYLYSSNHEVIGFPTNKNPKRFSFDSEDVNSGNVCAWRIGKKKAGSLLDGVQHKDLPIIKQVHE